MEKESKYLFGGWATPLKKHEFVNWDDENPKSQGENIGKIKNVPNHQPGMLSDGFNMF